ncbi:MAG: putative capsular polysaccharide synthesis family protein [Planctomycetota bacterium]
MGERRPILVHQMGKVGSRSVVDSLHASLPGSRIEHLHTVTPAGLAAAREAHERCDQSPPPHVAAGERVRREILDAGEGADVITLVREPVGRNVSAFFQNRVGRLRRASDAEVDALCERFIEAYPHTQPLQWFRREFDDVYGITMHQQPFDPARGSRVYEAERFRVLLLRCELADTAKSAAIAGFLGLPSMKWVRSNETSDKIQRDIYARFKQRLKMPEAVLDRLYVSQYSRHFYKAAEIETFRAKWSGAASSRPAVSG